MPLERLHKILASRGVASRRACEDLIAKGRVMVDGRPVVQLGTKVSPDADIRVDGRPVKEPPRVYYILNKPRGVLTTLSDEKGRKSVGDIVKRLAERVYPVGRLDQDSDGLVLLTNDGAITNVLTHPRYGVEKSYLVTARGRLDDEGLDKLRRGIRLSEGKAFAKVRMLNRTRDETRLMVTISQGYNRQVRRMFAAVGHKVQRLTRVLFGPLELAGLPLGALRKLTRAEVAALRAAAREADKHSRPRRSRSRRKGERHD